MTIEERLDGLETALVHTQRCNRRLAATLILGVVAAVGAFGAGLAAVQPAGGGAKEVRATSFVLEDENGKTRASVGMGKDGPGLWLWDENAKPRVMLVATKDGSVLWLHDGNGKGRAVLSASDDSPMLSLYDENDKTRARLAVIKEGAGLALSDENGKDRAALGVAKDGPGLSLWDENGKPSATLGASKSTTADGKVITRPESSLLLFGPGGNVRWKSP